MSERHYLLPKFGADWDDVEEALDDLGATELEPDEGCLQDWSLDDDETLVHLFSDSGLHLRHLVVEGKRRDEVAQYLRGRVPTYSPEDMPELFANEEVDFKRKLAVLADIAPESADPTLIELFQRGFDHEDPRVRERAALVATVPAWPELRPDIERLLDDDDEDVRESARVALRDLDRAAQRR